MSAPAAKALALPVSTMAPMPASASKASSAAPRESISASSSAFICRGLFSVMTPTRPWVSTRMGCSCMAVSGSVDDDLLFLDQRGQQRALVDQQLAEVGGVHGD